MKFIHRVLVGVGAFLMFAMLAACRGDNHVTEEQTTGAGSVGKGDFTYESTLPVLYITTGTGNKISEEYQTGALYVQGSEELPVSADTGYDGEIQIKLRGNSTRYMDKQPYHVKLSTKTDLLGLGENKHWLLLAEAIDHTLLRNQLVLRFAQGIGMENASNATSVVLCLNGKYRGVYTLCEQVRIGESCVDIMDWDKLAEKLAKDIVKTQNAAEGSAPGTENDEESKEKAAKQIEELKDALTANYSWASAPYTFTYKGTSYKLTDYEDIPALTGGWLMEMDFYHDPNSWDSVRTNYLQNFYFSEPSTLYTNQEAKEYAGKYLQSFEYALHSNDFTYHEGVRFEKAEAYGSFFDWNTGEWVGKISSTSYSDPEHDGWRYDDFFDMDSLVNNFLVCEFSRNWDCMKNSTFLYKDIEGKAYMGPAWDYDWAFGNINMYNIETNFPTGWQTTDKYFTNEQYYQNFNWNRYLIKDPVFVQALLDKYQEIRPTVIEDLVGEMGWLATTEDALKEEALLNDKLWSFTYGKYHGEKYEAACRSLNLFLKKRIEWLDAQFADYDTLYRSLNSYEQAENWWN